MKITIATGPMLPVPTLRGGEGGLRQAHDRLDRVEEALQERFPGTEILIHVDPEGQTDRATLLPEAITEGRD